jgi:hypothetical protein
MVCCAWLAWEMGNGGLLARGWFGERLKKERKIWWVSCLLVAERKSRNSERVEVKIKIRLID